MLTTTELLIVMCGPLRATRGTHVRRTRWAELELPIGPRGQLAQVLRTCLALRLPQEQGRCLPAQPSASGAEPPVFKLPGEPAP